jgi:hypothetical protein
MTTGTRATGGVGGRVFLRGCVGSRPAQQDTPTPGLWATGALLKRDVGNIERFLNAGGTAAGCDLTTGFVSWRDEDGEMAALLERLRSATADEAMPARFCRGSERLLVVGWPVGGGSASMIGLEPSPDSDCPDQLPCCAWAGNRQWERRPGGANLKVECPFNAGGSNGSGVEHHHQRRGGVDTSHRRPAPKPTPLLVFFIMPLL